MKKEIHEQDVIRLLEGLNRQGTSYPPELQQKRREAFLALGVSALLPGAAPDQLAGQAAAPSTHAAHLPMTMGIKLTLGFLSAIIVGLSTYLGITLYENRDALRDLLRAGTPTMALISPSPYNLHGGLSTPTYAITGTPTATPSPTGTIIATVGNDDSRQGTPTKPGWHYGQTKTPKPKLRK